MEGKAFIWDLDGTLLNSYAVILDNVLDVLSHAGIERSRQFVHEYIIRTSIGDLFAAEADAPGLEVQMLFDDYARHSKTGVEKIGLMPRAAETLRALKAAGARNYVYTHRGQTTRYVLEHNGILDCFEDLVTGLDGLKRKPEPDGLEYLIKKHGLDKERTYYVGDRRIDVECAKNAGVKAVLYLDANAPGQATGLEDLVIKDLFECTGIQ